MPEDTNVYGDLDVMSLRFRMMRQLLQFYSFQREGKQFVMLTDTGEAAHEKETNQTRCA